MILRKISISAPLSASNEHVAAAANWSFSRSSSNVAWFSLEDLDHMQKRGRAWSNTDIEIKEVLVETPYVTYSDHDVRRYGRR